jgi:hypothetical protein
MIGTAKSRLNYYEMLGIAPSATGDAIAEAFSKATNVLRPHAFGGITELCVAYETLRDPVRRRAYDASIGLAPKPASPPVSRPASAHFMVRPAVATAAPPQPPLETSELPPAPRFEPRPVRLDVPPPRPFALDDPNGISPIEWKRMGAVVGGSLAAAVLVGAIGGWWSVSEAANPGQQAPAETADRPRKKQPVASSEPRPEPIVYKAAKSIVPPRRAVSPQSRAERTNRRAQWEASQAEDQLVQAPSDLAEQNPGDPLAPEAGPASAVAAAMPLPHKTVARTIDRIGYACGSVASAAPVEGAAGVYTVTCSSGQSFQARPVNGRYRFKRLAKD